jgi:hypothetical protein
MTKIHKKPTEDQFENLESWINFYSENKKLPFNKIICSSCRNIFVSMKRARQVVHSLKMQEEGRDSHYL